MATILAIITAAANANGIPAPLAIAQGQQESGLNPNAYNPSSGATGLFQLLPATAASLGVTNLTDPVQNAGGGMRYLAQMYQRFGDWAEALAAYDWGPTNLANAIAKYGSDWMSYAPAETQNYVSSILSAAGMDETVSVTPASIYNGVTETASDAIDAASDQIDQAMPSTAGQILVLTGLGLTAYLLVRDWMD